MRQHVTACHFRAIGSLLQALQLVAGFLDLLFAYRLAIQTRRECFPFK